MKGEFSSRKQKGDFIQFVRDRCDFCGACVGVCPTDVIYLAVANLKIDHANCILCNFCVYVCPYRALRPVEGNEPRSI